MESSVKKLGRLCDVMEGKSCCKTKKNECKGKKCAKKAKVKAKAKNECGKACKKNESLEPKQEWFEPYGNKRKADFERDGLSVWDLVSAGDALYQIGRKTPLGIANNDEVFFKYRDRGPLYLCKWGNGNNEAVVVNVTHDGKMWVTTLDNGMPDRYSDPLEMLGKYPQLAPAVKERVLVYKPMSVEQAQRTESNPR